ncbi:MAG TPA: hypothetical protein VFK66_15275 [Oryzihumus sp.]|nr:hypothetical protein [Oryzihumus sp.]
MTLTDAAAQRVTVVAGGRHHDLVAPSQARVGDVLHALGIAADDQRYAVATPLGRVFGPYDLLAEVAAEATVLTVVDSSGAEGPRGLVDLDRSPGASGGRVRAIDPAPAPAVESGAPGAHPSLNGSSDPASPSSTAALALAAAPAGLALVALAVLGTGTFGQHHTDLPWLWGCSAALFLITAMALALRTGNDRASVGARLVAPVLGLAAGMSLPALDAAGAGRVALIAGCTVGAVVAGVARVSSGEREGAARVALVVLALLGVVNVLGVLLEWPGFAVAAVVAGLAPMVVRMLPSLSLDVPDEQLVDTERLSTTIWSVREPTRRRRRRIRVPELQHRFREARDVVAAGTLWGAALAPVALAVLLATPGRTSVSRWGAVALCVLTVMGLGYQSRAVRDRLPRFALLGAAAVVLAEGLYAVGQGAGPAAAAAVLAVVLVVAVACLAAAMALTRGWTSPRLSRLADALEGLAVVCALPAALVAGDVLEILRRTTSG